MTPSHDDFTILLVDDRPENIISLQELLDAPHRRFITATSGNEALKLALNHPETGLIMLDVQMPGMDGFEVAHMLQSNPKTREASIIFVTAINKEERYILKGFAQGAVDYLHKPLDINLTRAKVAVFEQLYRSRRKLAAALDESAAINKRLNRFSHIIAHDIKSPLSGMVTLVSVLQEDDRIQSNARVKQYVDLLHKAGLQLAEMVDAVLAYSGAQHSTEPMQQVDTAELVHSTIEVLFPPESITFAVAANMPVLHTSKVKLRQVFQNLLSNAIKYMDKAAGEIKISASRQGDYYLFTVSDNGPGMDEAAQAAMFRPFSPGTTTSERESSTGIGLNHLQHLVHEAGGEVKVDTQEGHGTTVSFTWPG